jgi:hypothetical protein
MNIPESIEDCKNYYININRVKVRLYEVVNYCLFLYFPPDGKGREYDFEDKRCHLHQKLYDFAGLDRIKDRDDVFNPNKFSEGLENLICHCFCCPHCLVSLNRNNDCFECDYHLKNSNELFRNIIVNNADKIKKYKK